MIVEGLVLPPLIDELVEQGRWPGYREDFEKDPRLPSAGGDYNRQLSRPRVAPDRVGEIAPGERRIVLLNPPFVSVASAIASKSWSPEFLRFAALDEIEPSLAVEVADFGPGSDSPIVLDFRGHGRHPRVFRLEWMKPDTGSSDSHWVELAPTLDAFVNRIGI